MAELPAAFVEHINWVKQPPPARAHETHALYFWVNAYPALGDTLVYGVSRSTVKG